MPTSVYLPEEVLRLVDARAKLLGISRNRFIVETLREKLEAPIEWPRELVRLYTRPVLDELDRELAKNQKYRSRKAAPKF